MPPSESAFISARPRYRVDGTLNDALAEATLTACARLPLNGRAHAELRFTNWGRRDAEATFQLLDIELGSELEVMFSEEHDQPQFVGEITAIEERYGDGAPQLVLLAEDKLHRLARARQTRTFDEQSLDDVIQAVAGEAGLDTDVQVSSTSATWHQLGESDFAFLSRLLWPFDVALRISSGQLRAKPEQSDSDPVQVDTQGVARRVRIIADLAHQPTSSRVMGWDLSSDGEASAEHESLQPAPQGRTAKAHLEDLGWSGPEQVPHPFATTQAFSDSFANASFRRSAKRFLRGEISCTGVPSLSVGREVELTGVSERLQGLYRVVGCEHRYDAADGYQTSLRVERPDWRG